MPDPLRGFPTDEPDPTQAPPLLPTQVEEGVWRRGGFPADDPDAADPLRVTLGQATKTPPATAAEIFQLRLKTGLPPGVIERNLAEVKRQAASADFDAERFRRDNPKLTGWLLAEPTRAPLVQDDLEPMSGVETALTKAGNVARSLGASGWGLAAELPWAGVEFAGDILEFLTGAPHLQLSARAARQGAAQTRQAIRPDPTGLSVTEQAIYSGVESIGMNLPLAAGAMVTGGGSGVALGLMGTAVGLESYTQARDVGADLPRAAMFAGTQAGLEVLTERFR